MHQDKSDRFTVSLWIRDRRSGVVGSYLMHVTYKKQKIRIRRDAAKNEKMRDVSFQLR